jgi:hypothetical protein
VQATLYLLTPPSHFLHTLFTLCRTHFSPPSQFLTLYKPHFIYLHLLHTFSTRSSHSVEHTLVHLHQFLTLYKPHFIYLHPLHTFSTRSSHSVEHTLVHLHQFLTLYKPHLIYLHPLHTFSTRSSHSVEHTLVHHHNSSHCTSHTIFTYTSFTLSPHAFHTVEHTLVHLYTSSPHKCHTFLTPHSHLSHTLKDTLWSIFMESYVSLGMVIFMGLMCFGFALAGGSCGNQ